jgi:O-acetyl-ADP-ribose deacetylase (regulator of RNase III)
LIEWKPDILLGYTSDNKGKRQTKVKFMSNKKKIGDSEVSLVKSDQTLMEVEAIVFFANPNLQLGSGFGSAISMRGGPSIKKQLDEIGHCNLGESVITEAGELPAKYIIHAVGPRFQEPDIESKLKATMINSLKIAEEKGITQIAYPPMGTGFFGISLAMCAKVMFDSIKEYLSGRSKIKEVIVCVGDNRELRAFEEVWHQFNTGS